jgi:predicted permease
MKNKLAELGRRLLALFHGGQFDADLKEEMRLHQELCEQEQVERGLSPEEAHYSAQRRFGNKLVLREESREMWGWNWLETFLQDVRYGLRQLRRNQGFTAIAVFTLALGIGATTAIFSMVNGVLLRPLPYRQPGTLVSVQDEGHRIGNPVSYPDFFDWQRQNHVFTGIASYHPAEFILTGAGEPLHIQAMTASAGLFGLLEVRPQLGRGFEPQDDQRGSNVVVLSHVLWSQHFGSDRSIVGRSIVLDNKSFTVIGVTPTGFEFPPIGRVDLWTSVAVDREAQSNIMTGRGYHSLGVIARLKPGISLVTARTDMDLVARRLASQYPETNAEETSVRLMPELDRVVGSVRAPLLIVLGVVVGVLLIACVNVANLLLARNTTRQKEIALRAALGASRWRVFRQLLNEGLLLSMLGGSLGILFSGWGTQLLLRLAPEDLPRISHVGMDWRVLLFAIALSLATGLLFSSVPAGKASKTDLSESIKAASQAPLQRASQGTIRSALVAVETALALLLLIGAGLLISSYLRLVHVDPGFDPRDLLTFGLDLPSPPYTDAEAMAFVNQLLPRLRAVPGVQSSATDWALPFSGDNPSTGMEFEGRTFAPGHTPGARIDAVTPDYFRTMGIPLLRGRGFTNHDRANTLPVVLINNAFARRFYPNEDPIGRRIRPSYTTTSTFPWRTVVGVVGNAKLGGLAEKFQPELYMPYAQVPIFNVVIVKTQGKPLRLAPAARTVVASLDKNVPVYGIEPMEDYLASSEARNRFSTLLLGLFGVVALAMAAAGIYGVVSYSVSQRTHEIGIRMALGAQKSDVLRLVVGQGMSPSLIGLGIGIAGAFGLTRSLSSMLYEVKPTDPTTFTAVSLILIGVALLASYIPARRATKVDPMVALRYE